MNKSIVWVFTPFILTFFACNQSMDSSRYFYTEEPKSPVNIMFDSIELDTVKLDPIESSLAGIVTINQDKLNFIDYQFGWIFEFDKDGTFLERKLGRGQGPSELPISGRIFFHAPTDERGHLFIGSSYDYHLFDETLERTETSIIRWKQDRSLDYLAKNPTPDNQRSYNPMYDIGDVRVKSNYAYIPLMGGLPGYSEFNFTTDLFAEEARLFGEMNLETGQMERIFGRYSPVYAQDDRNRWFSFFFFDFLDDDTIFLSFAADSLIHLFDLDFSHIGSFGRAGQYMSINYPELQPHLTTSEFERAVMEQWELQDFYMFLTCIPETGHIFRSYKISESDDRDGLQIYRDRVLIADIQVPKMTKITGYIDPWYYTNVHVDEIEGTKTVYRFQLEK